MASLTVAGTTGDKLMTAKEASRYLAVNRQDLYELALPRYRISEGRVRWRLSDLTEFLERRRET